MTSYKNILLTGVPAIGKTTLIKSISHLINNKYSDRFVIKGFYTQEVRNVSGQRIGFDVIDINNSENRKQLSRIDSKSGPKVGKYLVDIKSFESIAIPLISLNQTELKESSKTLIIIIDEIGKMEMFSDLFKRTIRQLFDSNINILATIPVQQNLELVQELRNRSDSKEICVERSNRDLLVDKVVRMLCENAIK